MILKHDNDNDAIVGVFLGGKILHAGKVKNDRIVKSTTKTIDNLASEEEVLEEVINAINEVFDDEVKGIGVGVPSLVDTENGIVYDVQHIPSWEEVHLKDILTDKKEEEKIVPAEAPDYSQRKITKEGEDVLIVDENIAN